MCVCLFRFLYHRNIEELLLHLQRKHLPHTHMNEEKMHRVFLSLKLKSLLISISLLPVPDVDFPDTRSRLRRRRRGRQSDRLVPCCFPQPCIETTACPPSGQLFDALAILGTVFSMSTTRISDHNLLSFPPQ